MEKVHIDSVVIGGGIVGQSVAAELSKKFSCVLLEKNARLIEETSSRNSGVVHSGVYYPNSSAKNKYCILGKEKLYEYCKDKDVNVRKTGKYIVSSKSNINKFEDLIKKCIEKNIPHEEISIVELKKIYPSIQSDYVLHIKDSGIVDVHDLSRSLEQDFLRNNGSIQLGAWAKKVFKKGNRFEVLVEMQNESYIIETNILIFSLGLRTPEFFKAQDELDIEKYLIPMKFYIGHYYKCKNFDNFKHLIYPIPEKNSLGIHICFNLYDNYITFGPDAELIEYPDISLNKFGEDLEEKFYSAISSYIPSIRDYHINPDYVGIRPKIESQDFQIIDESTHNHKNCIVLNGIESPGLTSSIAIGQEIANRF